MSTQEQFLAEIEAFLETTGMAASDFGLRVVNDASFVQRLRAGSDVRTRTMDKCRDFMRNFGGGASRRRPSMARAVA